MTSANSSRKCSGCPQLFSSTDHNNYWVLKFILCLLILFKNNFFIAKNNEKKNKTQKLMTKVLGEKVNVQDGKRIYWSQLNLTG